MTLQIGDKTYYKKANGTLVPEDQVKDSDRLRDQFVLEAAEKIMDIRTQMIRVKAEILDDIEAFMQTMSESYGVKLGGEKGNLSFTSFDGRVQLKYYRNDYLTFNEGIHIAKKLIDEFLEDITKDSSRSIKQIVNSAFNLKQGRMDVKAILKLREINETDPRWVKAMQIIDESKQWNEGSRALRLYIRGKTGEMELVPMDFTSLMGEAASDYVPMDAEAVEVPEGEENPGA